MRTLRTAMSIMALSFAAACSSPDLSTTVYLVRHAEKVPDRGLRNPDLTEAGHARAEQLADLLKHSNITRIYTTPFLRNRATVAPLASAVCVVPETYKWEESTALAGSFRSMPGEHILVCGHVDNLLPMLAAMGCTAPVDSIGSEVYGQLFIARLSPNGGCIAELKHF